MSAGGAPSGAEAKAALLPMAAGWLLLASPGAGGLLRLPAWCLSGLAVPAPGWDGVELAILMNPPGRLASAWTLMLLTTMPPLLIPAVRLLRERSFARRRVRAIGLFLAAYALVWMAAGAVLVPAALLLQAFAPPWLPAWSVGVAIAVLWQASPAKQASLNRLQRVPRLAAFGWPADAAALRYGFIHAVWCVGACWALMALPLLVGSGHGWAMALALMVLFAERLERPRPCRWRLALPRTAIGLATSFASRCLRLLSPATSGAPS